MTNSSNNIPMNKIILKTIILLLFVIYGCDTQRENIETLAITNHIINNCKRFDSTFIILQQKQGLFDYVKVDNDSVAFLFNRMAFSYNNFENLALKFNLDSIKTANRDYDFGVITGHWNLNIINGIKFVALKNNLTESIDSILICDWNSFKGLKTKKFCIISDPVFSIDKSQAIIGIQIFTDSLYNLNIIELQKNKEWEVLQDIVTKNELIDVKFVKIEANEFSVKPSKTKVISGWEE